MSSGMCSPDRLYQPAPRRVGTAHRACSGWHDWGRRPAGANPSHPRVTPALQGGWLGSSRHLRDASSPRPRTRCRASRPLLPGPAATRTAAPCSRSRNQDRPSDSGLHDPVANDTGGTVEGFEGKAQGLRGRDLGLESEGSRLGGTRSTFSKAGESSSAPTKGQCRIPWRARINFFHNSYPQWQQQLRRPDGGNPRRMR